MSRAGAHRTERTLPPISREKLQWRPAMSQARLLPRRQLINPSGEQQQAREDNVPAGHGFGKQSGPVGSPLKSSRYEAERAPNRDMSKRELSARALGVGPPLCFVSAITNRMAGAPALGSIIATIMMIHIRKIIAAYWAVHGGAISMIWPPPMSISSPALATRPTKARLRQRGRRERAPGHGAGER
jgi:hypothetical protein